LYTYIISKAGNFWFERWFE